MKTRAELKAMAKAQIKGNIGILFVITLIVGLISGALSLIPTVGSVASFVLTPAFAISILRVYQGLVEAKKPEVGDAFAGFDDFWTAFKTYFLVGLYTFLWSLLFIIPGIIKGYAYSQALLIVAENKGISAREAIKRSQAMMEGHKMDLFVLSLSFIGWALLCGVTFGIAYIWVGPYMQATLVNFYNDIKPATEVPVAEVPVEAVPVAEAVVAEEAPVDEVPAEGPAPEAE